MPNSRSRSEPGTPGKIPGGEMMEMLGLFFGHKNPADLVGK